MSRRDTYLLIVIIILAILAVFIAVPEQHPTWFKSIVAFHQKPIETALTTHLGLDLRGGTQVQLEAEPSSGQTVSSEDLETAKTIIERRVNGLGVSEALVQTSGDRIIVALPGVEDPDAAIETLRGTGQLELVDIGNAVMQAGDPIITSLSASDVPTGTVVYQTILTGNGLKSADVVIPDQTREPTIVFELKPDAARTFLEHTSSHIGQQLAIVMDGVVLSAPTINAAISDQGEITGSFTLDEARNLAIQMQYGALPVALSVVDVRTVGPSLGQDSVNSSVRAGIIGVAVVLLFMILFYRIPGFLAALALLIYVTLNLAIYKVVPVTLTLAGIAGFLLSIGMAVDANILIFERMKEELRAGRSLNSSVEAGFARAWTSILDSNLSTLLTCLILYWFGSNFGASIVQGFAVTLGIGVLLSMFTAVLVTRTFMRLLVRLFGQRLSRRPALLGV